MAFPRFRPVRGIARLRPYRRTAVRTEAIALSARTYPPLVMRGKRPLMAGIAVGSFCMTRRCSGLKRLLILTAIFAHWLVVLPGAHAHDDYDASPARSHHRRTSIEDHHRHARDHWNENIAKPIEDFANDVSSTFKDLFKDKDSSSPSPVTGVDERCPWIGQGDVGAARANPLTKALIESTRMSHPFGPGARDERFEVQAEAPANGGGSEENGGRKFGWKDAVILAATVKIDQSAAGTWLPKPVLNISDVDEAIVFIAWYPDSFCCGAYHEAALLLKVTVDGRRALHCPWMLVDSDTSMIAGREILGFPKKMGEFTFEVKPPSPSDTVSDNGVGTEPMDVAAKEFDPVKSFEPGSRVTASVSRNGATVMSISGVVGALEPTDPSSGDVRTIMPRQRNVFLNAQTSHPLVSLFWLFWLFWLLTSCFSPYNTAPG